MLREGSSSITCRADDPSVRAWIVHCYPEELEAFVARSEELRKEDVDTPERIKTLTAEISSGTIQLPDIAVIYARQGNSVDTASGVVIAHVPNATGRSTGLPTLPTRGSPWLAETGDGEHSHRPGNWLDIQSSPTSRHCRDLRRASREARSNDCHRARYAAKRRRQLAPTHSYLFNVADSAARAGRSATLPTRRGFDADGSRRREPRWRISFSARIRWSPEVARENGSLSACMS